ncbi:site-specific integrase [Ascidiaceihabitans sp.]|nr:site-specific integrase [Ascidiaceihabitans sp.]
MTQLFLNIYRAARFEDASSHSCRRTFITELANKGVSVRVLAELAGHSSHAKLNCRKSAADECCCGVASSIWR